jgi:hypothetical protein
MSYSLTLLSPNTFVPGESFQLASGSVYTLAPDGSITSLSLEDTASLVLLGFSTGGGNGISNEMSINALDPSITDYTIQGADDAIWIVFQASDPCTLNIPVGLGQGFSCAVLQWGTGTVTLVPMGPTINSPQSFTQTASQFSSLGLEAVFADQFLITGDGA